ncbi:DEAD/DEAH box helicase family protein [Sphingomonas olei]|uniref:Type III restriction endonuclease subunit R n=1 Tax=Sphingomonas olei TaxID=1886787 RepID=A0ABY2QKM0_9SPHN|nr:DEAD/DEAH box helicase family protein [Sphingomonas olei]THG41157.1 type III restriction endonuclease subunit R [Sphingomonas olei]
MAWRELAYQTKALAALDAWLERLAEERAKADQVAAVIAANPELDIALPNFPAKAWERLASDKGVPGGRAYSPRVSGDGKPVPNVTLKVPTGGGKTYLACAALSRVFGRYIGANTGMVLWIVPNEAIYTQTLKALRNREHAYRQTLDRASANRTIILEKGDPLNRADLATNLCVMVLMLQSSNRENQDSLRLFRDRGDVHGFVPPDGEQGAHAALLEAVSNLSIYDLGDGTAAWPMVKASMGNAMRVVRPVVIMDEGQRAVSDLAFQTLYGFNPSLVLELSATPKDVAARPNRPARTANILVEISGRELESEGMIKMPMNVASLPAGEWQATLQAAWDRLSELERVAKAYEGDGGRYIRPILLVQVERTGSEQADAGFIHANDAREWLKAVAGLEDDEIAFKTAERNDLDKPENRDLLSRRSPVRAIITKAALAEGWDCPFAYVLCALAANGNESAMTQLVGRILRQPYAEKTEYRAGERATPLDECYVFAHRADTAATVAAIKRGLENDGLGDLARDVHLSDPGGGAAGAPRAIQRREGFKALRIALPRVLAIEPDTRARELDAETDLFPLIDWTAFDVAALGARLPKDARPPDSQFVRLRAGDHGVETDAAAALASEAPFDTAYAVRSIGDLVANVFAAWAIVDRLLSDLRGRSWDDALIGRLSAFIIAELRTDLAKHRDGQAATLFAAGLDAGTIRFGLRGGDDDWIAPAELWTTLPPGSEPLLASNYGQLERSLFLPIYAAELNDAERKFAVYLDRDDAVRWWHRNGTTPRSYALRGWRRGNVYPDFLFAALSEGERERVVVIETKGEQLAGNADTEYKRALLSLLSDKFDPTPPQTGALGMAEQAFDFSAAVVLFGELDAKLPVIIQGEPTA